MNKPKLRFKEFNDEWNSNTFDKVFKTMQNNCLSRDLLNGTDDNCTKNVHYGDILVKYGAILDCNNVTLPSIDSTVDLKKFNAESYLKDGDIIIADTAEDYTVGKSCEIVNLHDKVLSGLHTIPCRPLLNFASRYLGYYINSYSYHDSLIPLVTGIKVSSISKSSIAKTIVKYPSLDEQKKIAEFLSKVDEVIVEREEEVKDLEQQKKGLMQKIFSQQLRFTDSNNNPYPDWEESTIGNLFSIKAGGDIDTQKCSKEKTDKYKYPVYANALSKNGLYGYTDEYKVSGDTITVTGRGDVGHATPRHEQYYPIVRLLVLSPKYSANVDFFASLINSTKIFIESTGVPQLTSPQLAKVKVKYPCFEEQQKIANLLSKLDELIEEKKALLADWQSFKKGLLQQMFV